MVKEDDTVIGVRPAFTARHDIKAAQIADTAERVADYFRVLTNSGISVGAATDMTDLFNAMLLHQHFGVEWNHPNSGNLFSFLESE